ncbi:plasmid pRiA4b ORF-3 family protein [Facklamia sp. P12934]|uniref:plasmid pRiA4b ORF-3 family protein n=1 Tax=unclassified Facklamia TaxID=2622293 RepID=UPI003D178FE3
MIQLKVQLVGIKNPAIWRNMIVPDRTTFFELHCFIQCAFGLEDRHLFSFQKYGTQLEIDLEISRDYDFSDAIANLIKKDAEKTLVLPYLYEYSSINYTYDFGDNWEFKITLMKEDVANGGIFPQVVASKGENIPEDCGGVGGLENLRELSKTPDSKEFKRLCEWNPSIGQDFNKENVNQELQDLYNKREGAILLPDHVYDFLDLV